MTVPNKEAHSAHPPNRRRRWSASNLDTLVHHVRKGLRDGKGTTLEEAAILAMTRLTAQIVARSLLVASRTPTDSLRFNPTFYTKGRDDVLHWLESRRNPHGA